MKSGYIYVWDPNPFNPYGTEVARVINEAVDMDVVHFTRKGRSFCEPNVRTFGVLPASTGGKRSQLHAIVYLIGLAWFVLIAIANRPLVIFPWISNRWEALGVRVMQIMRVRTVVVVHNPVPERDDIDRIRHLRKARHAALCQVVHTQHLTQNVVGRTKVAAHPAYRTWVASMRQRHVCRTVEASSTTSVRPSAVFIGSVRADKGFYRLPELAVHLQEQGLDLIVCVGVYADSDVSELRRLPNVVLIGEGRRYLTDDELYRTLIRSSVVVAPYQEVTVSGSVLLAMSVGLPVVGYASESLAGLLPQRALVQPGDLAGLSTAARNALILEDGEFTAQAIGAQDAKSVHDWKCIIDQLS